MSDKGDNHCTLLRQAGLITRYQRKDKSEDEINLQNLDGNKISKPRKESHTNCYLEEGKGLEPGTLLEELGRSGKTAKHRQPLMR